jgi:hypothetical protein
MHADERAWAREQIVLLREIRDLLLILVGESAPQRQATTAVLSTTGGNNMTTAILTFTDASGNPIAPPTGDGSGIVVTFASDNPAVTVGTATGSGDQATATITGTEAFNLSATVANASGAALLDNDGVTAFEQPSSIAVAATTPVDQAVTATLSTE